MSSSAPADGGTDVDLVLSVLDDEGSRALLLAADEHRSAQELADLTDIPNSTVYRKLDRLSAAGLVDEATEIRADGKHATRYRTDFQAVRIALDGFERFEVEVERPTGAPDRRLADLWSQVREET
jgi:DNA-binding transcriptional ArsR family regulator